MSRTRFHLTLDTLRIVRILLDDSTGHTAYSISRKLDLGYSGVRFALKTMVDWEWLTRTQQQDEKLNRFRVFYRLTPLGHDRVVTALESIGATIAPPRVFIGAPPPRHQVGIFAAST